MKKGKVKIKVIKGSPIINSAIIYKHSSEIVCICIDMTSKYCEIDYTGNGDNEGPSIGICSNKHSLYLDEKRKNKITQIYFTEYKNWDIFSVNITKYTCFVVLTKNKKVVKM
jgi:hypothetical protein